MEKYMAYVDAGFKIVLAISAAWSAYLFGFRKQQNDDLRLVIELVADSNPQKRLMGVGLASAFIEEDRIPQAVFSNLLTTLRDQNRAPASPDEKMRDKSVQEAANAALNKAASTNAAIQSQLASANAALPVRIYFQTANDGDRTRANTFGDKIERLASTSGLERAIIVPEAETIAGYAGPTELRCFKAAECRDVAPRLISFLRVHGATALAEQPTDLSKQYESSNKIRPMHFEVWFGAGKIP